MNALGNTANLGIGKIMLKYYSEICFGGLRPIKPNNPRGTRSKSIENLCKGKGEWNSYTVVCLDGVIELSVNGKFVNGISKSTVKKGYVV
jgi:hypothetical protein